MSSDDEFENAWLDSAEVDAVALAIERGEMSNTRRIEIEMEGADGRSTAKKRNRSSSVELIEKPPTKNPYRTPYQRFRKHAGFLAATDVSDDTILSVRSLKSLSRSLTCNGAHTRSCIRKWPVAAGYRYLSRSSPSSATAEQR